MNIHFDHFITYTNAANMDEYLKQYSAQGFAPDDKTVRHAPGLRNGFIWFGPEYIEFCWVEDEALFAKAGAQEKILRKEPRPFAIGMITRDVQAVHAEWTARGYKLPEVESKAVRDAAPDAPPRWSFQYIPDELLPGASCFALTYHSRPKDEVKQLKIPPNTIYAVSGVSFVTPQAQSRAERWRDLLAPEAKVSQSGYGFTVQVPPHQAEWLTPEAYQAAYQRRWIPRQPPYGDLALLHLLATDLRTVKKMLEASGRPTISISHSGEERILIEPDPRDGFAFLVQERPAEPWLQQRIAQTGERLVLV
jgi:hypothetical protein